MSYVVADVRSTEETTELALRDGQDAAVQPQIRTSDTTRTFRLDNAHPRISRAEDSLRDLRQRMERHMDQEVHLGRLYQGWQQCWSFQCEQIQRQVARLEAHIAAWLPRSEMTPALSIVGRDGE